MEQAAGAGPTEGGGGGGSPGDQERWQGLPGLLSFLSQLSAAASIAAALASRAAQVLSPVRLVPPAAPGTTTAQLENTIIGNIMTGEACKARGRSFHAVARE